MAKVSVLIVDDDEVLRDVLVETLRTDDLDAMGVGTAADFIRALAIRHFDIAVVDLGLPDGDGKELVARLRRETDMGIVVLTSRGEIGERMGGYDAGADRYFVKPADTQELAEAVLGLKVRQTARANGG